MELVTCVTLGEEFKVEPETMMDERSESDKALVDAQMKDTCENYARELDPWRNSFKAHESEVLRDREALLLEQERICTESDAKASRYHDVLPAVRRLVLDSI